MIPYLDVNLRVAFRRPVLARRHLGRLSFGEIHALAWRVVYLQGSRFGTST